MSQNLPILQAPIYSSGKAYRISCSNMSTTRETFDKSERLCSVKLISGLFENGNIFYNSLFKVVWGISPVLLPFPAQVAFSVSKKRFKLAVTRNLIKRRMREAYRKNKKTLYEHLVSQRIQIVFLVVLKVNSVPDYLSIEKSTIEMMNKLMILSDKKTEAGRRKSDA